MAPIAPPDPPHPLGDVQLALGLALALLVGFLLYGAWTELDPPTRGAAAPGYRVDLNHAPTGELRALPGVGAVLAQRIADERRRAPFRSTSDLARVYGIGPVLVDRIRPHVLVGAQAAPR